MVIFPQLVHHKLQKPPMLNSFLICKNVIWKKDQIKQHITILDIEK
jgi:hypothetical protein